MVSKLLGKPSTGQRLLLSQGIEKFNYPENIQLATDNNWPLIFPREKSVLATFLIDGDEVVVECFIWGQFNIKSGSQHCKTVLNLYRCVFEDFRTLKVKEAVNG